MAKAIHSMIRVVDVDRTIRFYGEAFGLKVADRYDFESFVLVYLRNAESGFELELTSNKDRDAAYDLGDGYGHIAFSVDDLEAEHERFTSAGFAPKDIKEITHDGHVLGRFFFVADPDGYQIEVLRRSGRFE